jgi:putative addiction module CopG family antidote
MTPTFRGVDCLLLKVSDLDAAIEFYCARLGHALHWRTEAAAGLLMGGEAELVLHLEIGPEVDLLVDDVPNAYARLLAAGATTVQAPFEIQVGLCARVADPWGNELTILDLSKGLLRTDEDRTVVGNRPPRGSTRGVTGSLRGTVWHIMPMVRPTEEAPMRTRNVVLTDHQADLVEQLVASGRYQNASEVLREGLRLIEAREREESARLKALRHAAQVGIDDIEAGRYRIFGSADELEDHLTELADAVLGDNRTT